MRALGWIGCVVLAVLLLVNIGQGRDAQRYNRAERERLEGQVSLWRARYAEAAVRVERDVDTVRVRVTSVKELRDTLNIRDTIQVLVYLERADSALNACTELANSCALFKVTADSLIASQRTELGWWVTHDKGHHSLRTRLRDRVGLTLGWGAAIAGGQVYVGPQVGISLRLAP